MMDKLHADLVIEDFHNYPNPFHPPSESTRFAFMLSGSGAATNVFEGVLQIFTYHGRLVKVFDLRKIFATFPQGVRLEFAWDGRTDTGTKLPIGIYYAVLRVAGSGSARDNIKVVIR